MNEDNILDSNHLSDPDSWDSRTRIQISDAIIEVNDHVKKVVYGKYILVALLLFSLVGLGIELISIMGTDASDYLLFLLIFSGIYILPFFLGVVFYARNPRLWLVIGLVMYILSVLLGALAGINPAQGFLWKIATIVGLSFGLYSAAEWTKNLKKLQALGFPRDQLEVARKELSPLRRIKRKAKP